MTSVYSSPTEHDHAPLVPFYPDGPVVTVSWLAEHLGQDNLVVLCAAMNDAEQAQAAGIPGAHLADLEADFSDQSATLPHTVPGNLKTVLESYGISDDTTVVVYDRQGLMVAPRVWWLLRAAGLTKIGVLDGGLPAWKAAGLDVTELAIPVAKGNINAAPRPELLVGADGVERAIARSSKAVVDARSAGRFSGVEDEPRPGLKKGSIPGSVNIPFDEVVDAEGLLRAPADLRELFEQRTHHAKSLVFSCGSGVTACVDAYAAVVAGYEDVVVYDGSWAEWGNPKNQRPIA